MADINWEEAPEGTTHVLLNLDGTHNRHWRRVEGGAVCEHYGGRWRKINDTEVWFREFAVSIVERPPQAPQVVGQPQPVPQVVRINGVEVDWGQAPEGTTHAATKLAAIRAYGQWRKLENNTVSDWKGGEWVARDFINAEEWKRTNHGQFIEKPGLVVAAPVAKKEQLVVKKPVGWWS